MPILKQRAGHHEIEVGAFSDIAFLLIIFFILTTTFIKPAGDRMTIPAGSESQENKSNKQITVNLKPDLILWNGHQQISIEELRIKLQGERLDLKEDKDRSVILDSSPAVPYQQYFEVVMAISRAGGVVALMESGGGEAK